MSMTDIDIETIRGWASTGFLGFIAFTLARFASPFAAYMTKRLEVRAQERKDEREGYGPLITLMQQDIENVRKHHAECEAARQKDAERIATLEGQVAGLTRVITSAGIGAALRIPSSTGKDQLFDLAERSAIASLDSINKQRGDKEDG
jgi:hypothetical protein